jgi:WD40 repeat protein
LSDLFNLNFVVRSSDDRKVITAVTDLTLKIWDSSSGHLLSTLRGHEDNIFVLEPHPVSVNILVHILPRVTNICNLHGLHYILVTFNQYFLAGKVFNITCIEKRSKFHHNIW